MLRDVFYAVANRGTGRAAALSVPTFGKTGTTQDYRDALFVGFAGGLVVGVWIGNDDNSPLPRVAGGGQPARIWRSFMSEALGIGPARPIAPIPLSQADRVAAPASDPGNTQAPISDQRFGDDVIVGPGTPPQDDAPPPPEDREPTAAPPPTGNRRMDPPPEDIGGE